MLQSPPRPRIVFAERSDPGCDPKKQVNEDSAGSLELPGAMLMVVCDGMGGHSGGREASQLAVQTVISEVERIARDEPSKAAHIALREAVQQAGRNVYQLGGPDGTMGRPGSTIVALLVHNEGTEVAHAGDSRIYLIRNGQPWQMTRDHSLVQQMVEANQIRPEDAHSHPDAHVVTRALGMRPEVDVELRHEPFPHQAGDLFLLVSDGVTDVMSTQDMIALIAQADSNNLGPLCDQIVQLARSRGGPDNITVQAALILDNAVQSRTERKTITDVVPLAGDIEPTAPLLPLQPVGQSGVTAPIATAPSPTSSPTAPPKPPAMTAKGTAVLPVMGGATATPAPGSGSGATPSSTPPSGQSDSARRAASPTIVDGVAPTSVPKIKAVSRTPRLALGCGLIIVGIIVAVICAYIITSQPESAPPPTLEERPGQSAQTQDTSAPSPPAPTASAAQSASPVKGSGKRPSK